MEPAQKQVGHDPGAHEEHEIDEQSFAARRDRATPPRAFVSGARFEHWLPTAPLSGRS